MSFAENLKQIRKDNHLSQEELAELLNVSRQAVSKWEQDQGYPEVEKLLLLSDKLHISLDALMSVDADCHAGVKNENISGSIVIMSPHENVIATCYKVAASGKMRGGKDSNFWGEPTTFLGWYANEEQFSKEIEEIHRAISTGIPTYTLQYSAKTQRRWASVKMIEA